MNLRYLIISIVFVSNFNAAFGQSKDFSTILKQNGDSIQLRLEVVIWNNKEVIHDDEKEDVISGKNAEGETVDILKSEIEQIRMRNGLVFEIFKDESRTYVGSFVAKGHVNLFETFGAKTLTSPVPEPQARFNVYATSSLEEGYKIFWELVSGQLVKVKPHKTVTDLRQSCPALDERLTIFKSLDSKSFAIDNINYYNQVCGSENPHLKDPSKVVLFRKKGGQKNLTVIISVNGEKYSFGRNHLEVLEIENAVEVVICDTKQNNCITKTFSPDRTNFVEISLRNKDVKPTIEYVDNAYGALKTKWIKEAMK